MRAVVVACALLAGCVSFSSLQRAEVVPEKQTRVGLAPFAGRSGDPRALPFAIPVMATVRHGLGHGWDVGARLWLVGAGVGVKYQFVDAGPLNVAVAPELSLFTYGGVAQNAVDLAVPVLAGIDLGPHQLVLGASVVTRNWRLQPSSDVRNVSVFPSAILGVDFALGGGVHLLPEATLTWWSGGQQLVGTYALAFQYDVGG